MKTINCCTIQVQWLSPLLQILRELAAPLEAHQMRRLLEDVKIDDGIVMDAASFADDSYVRSLYHRDEMSELLVLGWKERQASPLHDHGRSECGMRILSGNALEVEYRETQSGFLSPVSIEHLSTDAVTVCPKDAIHQIANEYSEPLVTLHLYSPPLADGRLYSPETSITYVPVPTNTPPVAVAMQ